MTLGQKLHLDRIAKRVGAMMDAAERRDNSVIRVPNTSIHINAHENRITLGDSMEVHIHLSDSSACSHADIEKLVAGAIEGSKSRRRQQKAPADVS